jgi:hypothetical protein
MVVVMMMVPVAPAVVVVVVVVVMGLRELHSGLCRSCRRAFIDHLQRRHRVRDRLQQFSIGTGV